MKNIVFVSTFRQKCGIATYCEALRTALQLKGMKVSVLAEVPLPPDTAQPEPDVYRLWQRGHAYKAQHGLSAVIRAIESSKVKPDIVSIQHEFGLFDNFSTLQLLRDLADRNIKTSITLHTVLSAPYQTNFFDRLCDVVIVHTPAQYAILHTRGFHTAQLIPHGTEVTPLPTGHNIICPGFISRNKGHDMLLKAFAESHIDAKFLLVGECRDEFYWRELTNSIANYGLTQSVHVMNAFQANLKKTLATARIVVLGSDVNPQIPAHSFSASGQLHTAMGCGIPILARNAPIYHDGVALLYDDVLSCAAGMRALYSSIALQNELRTRGLTVAAERSWDKVADRHLATWGFSM